jgi:hypothetical protein
MPPAILGAAGIEIDEALALTEEVIGAGYRLHFLARHGGEPHRPIIEDSPLDRLLNDLRHLRVTGIELDLAVERVNGLCRPFQHLEERPLRVQEHPCKAGARIVLPRESATTPRDRPRPRGELTRCSRRNGSVTTWDSQVRGRRFIADLVTLPDGHMRGISEHLTLIRIDLQDCRTRIAPVMCQRRQIAESMSPWVFCWTEHPSGAPVPCHDAASPCITAQQTSAIDSSDGQNSMRPS